MGKIVEIVKEPGKKTLNQRAMQLTQNLSKEEIYTT
jgi:hypothetical protein